MNFTVQQLYDMVKTEGQHIVVDQVRLRAFLVALGVFLLLSAGMWLIGTRRFGQIALVAFIGSFLMFNVAKGGEFVQANDIANVLANDAITAGVDNARKAQATELQYIHAPITNYGVDTQTCQRTVNYHDFCSSNTRYYNHREINSRQVCSTYKDSDGKPYESCHEEHDDEYTPWFNFISRYWIVPATKAKYLHGGVYAMEASDPNAAPKVFLHNDWRAPEDAESQRYGWGYVGSYNNHVPEFYQRVRTSMESQGSVVVGNFVGAYFHWGHAAEDAQYVIYDGHYQSLKAIVELPGANGAAISYTDAFGRGAMMYTLLTSTDGELALDFQPITVLGVSLDQTLLTALNKTAVEFQGAAGPQKEASFRWFIVSDTIKNQMGGLGNVTTALKAYLNDETVWGHFRLPKNLVILVTSVTDDGSRITGRDMQTGMPFGNLLVMQRIRMSLPAGETLPLTPENMIGSFTDSYTPQANGLNFVYSPMAQAGAVISLLYQNETESDFVPPDPNSDECSTAKAEHLGFIRYQMCTQQYLESTIKINADGADLIVRNARNGAYAAVPLFPAGAFLVLSILALVAVLWGENQGMSSSFKRKRF